MANKIQLMRGTKAQLVAKGGLSLAEPGYCADTKDLYIGNASGGDTLFLAAENIPYNLYRQALINGNFNVWQRGASFLEPNGIYTADRWRVENSVDGHVKVFQASDVPNRASLYSCRMEAYGSVSASGNSSVIQIIEDGSFFIGRTAYLCGYYRCDSGVSAFAKMEDGTQAPSVTLNATVWTYFSVPITVSTSAIQLIARIGFNRNGIAVGKGVNFTQLQLSTGTQPFQPRSYGEEMALCQRYASSLVVGAYDEIGVGISSVSNTVYVAIPLSVRPRIISPTYVFTGSVSLTVGSTEYTIQAADVSIVSTSGRNGGIKISGSGMPSISAGLPVKLRANLGTIAFMDAEI